VKRGVEELAMVSEELRNKNAQIQKVLEEKMRSEEGLLGECKEMREHIKNVEDKLYQQEQQHQIELLHLKERMSRTRDEEVQGLQAELDKVKLVFIEEKKVLGVAMEEKDGDVAKLKAKFEAERERYKEEKERYLKKIADLKDRLRQFEGEREAGETELFLKSLREMEARDGGLTNYEDGVTFLDRQLKKALSKVEQKNI
jgi:chromosome segregation ATPase